VSSQGIESKPNGSITTLNGCEQSCSSDDECYGFHVFIGKSCFKWLLPDVVGSGAKPTSGAEQI